MLRTLVLATRLLGVTRVLVVAHTDCRMARSTEEEVHAAALEAMQLLEQRRFTDFLDRWPAPADKKLLLEGTTLEKRAADFARGPANKLLDKLRKASVDAPKWNEAKTEASFFTGETDPDFVLAKEGGRWYIRNN